MQREEVTNKLLRKFKASPLICHSGSYVQELRDKALSRPLDMSSLEAALSRAVESLSARVAAVREQIDNVASSEAALDAKLERRRAELQRAEKRLHTVQKIK